MTTTAADFLAELFELDVRLTVEGEQLCVDAPEGTITPEHLKKLKHDKPAILEIFSGDRSAETDKTSDNRPKPQAENSKLPPPDERLAWVSTPLGPAKVWGFLSKGRVGVVLRDKPQVVTWMRSQDLRPH
ncbi:hypothetical protein MYX78_01660 [Acidobacteria bacterium AH-259-G07]|nr:hypothetical protein [Acidobacteria bacterium AH-259-G07]